jgi:hypothetical protein
MKQQEKKCPIKSSIRSRLGPKEFEKICGRLFDYCFVMVQRENLKIGERNVWVTMGDVSKSALAAKCVPFSDMLPCRTEVRPDREYRGLVVLCKLYIESM